MTTSSPFDHLPSGYAEDAPFTMSEPALPSMTEFQEKTDSLQTLSSGFIGNPFHRNRFFGGICLALPLSALLWFLIYRALQLFAL
jgi:hypothetical protein